MHEQSIFYSLNVVGYELLIVHGVKGEISISLKRIS